MSIHGTTTLIVGAERVSLFQKPKLRNKMRKNCQEKYDVSNAGVRDCFTEWTKRNQEKLK